MSRLINRDRYVTLKSLVADLIEDYGVAYPIDPLAIASQFGAEVFFHKHGLPPVANELHTSDGFTEVGRTAFGVSFRIHINGAMPEARQRFTLAHECAHIWLDHLVDINRSSLEICEQEANFFASYLLAPDVLINEWVSTGQVVEIANKFNVSFEAATLIFKRYVKALSLGSLDEDFDDRIRKSATRRIDNEIASQMQKDQA